VIILYIYDDDENEWVDANETDYDGAFAQFNSGNTCKLQEYSGDDVYNGTYTYKDDVITCKINDSGETITVIFKVFERNGNTITFLYNDIKIKGVKQ
jgi:hypothetical protein